MISAADVDSHDCSHCSPFRVYVWTHAQLTTWYEHHGTEPWAVEGLEYELVSKRIVPGSKLAKEHPGPNLHLVRFVEVT